MVETQVGQHVGAVQRGGLRCVLESGQRAKQQLCGLRVLPQRLADLAEHTEHLRLQGRVVSKCLDLVNAAFDQLDGGHRAAGRLRRVGGAKQAYQIVSDLPRLGRLVSGMAQALR